jgi:hypothetical protein
MQLFAFSFILKRIGFAFPYFFLFERTFHGKRVSINQVQSQDLPVLGNFFGILTLKIL